MGENKNIPQIRFKEFEGKWKSAEMNKVAEFSKGHSYSKKDLVKEGKPIILYGRLYTNYESTISDVDTFAIEKPGSKYSNGSEVIVPASGETAEDIAIASVVLKPDIILGGDLNIIYPNELIDSVFLALTISHGKQHKELSKKAQGKSIVHLRNSDIKETTLFYTGKDEQSKIGTYFQNLDKLITLQQQKHDKLVTLKKAMLDKMFPKEGADVPEIRFKGFKEAWKERRLGEVAVVSTGYPFESSNFEDGGEYLVITNGNIQNDSPFVDSIRGNRIGIKCNPILNDFVLKMNDILVTMDGTVGRTAKVCDEKLILAQRVGRIQAPSDPEFLYQFLNTGKFIKEMTLLSIGGTIKHISLTELMNYSDKLPNTIEEQSKIGSYFQNLDKLISLHQQEIQKLKNIKKACLEKMFV